MDEEKSITRQIAHAHDYASKKGWIVADAHVYADDGISGAEFVKRPALLRLMNALKPHPSFQVLIMSEESRLGRESIETSYLMKQILDAGVRVFFYLDDRDVGQGPWSPEGHAPSLRERHDYGTPVWTFIPARSGLALPAERCRSLHTLRGSTHRLDPRPWEKSRTVLWVFIPS